MKRDFVLVKRENLEKLIEDAHLWRALGDRVGNSEELKPEDQDAIILDYCESNGIWFPSDFSGQDALDVLVAFDIDFYHEVIEYDKRKND